MEKSFKKRLIETVILWGLLTLVMLGLRFFFPNKSDWDFLAITCSLAWALGYFIAKTLANTKKALKRIVRCEIILFMATFIVLVGLGILFNISNWNERFLKIPLCFGSSMLLNNKWF